MTRNVTRNRSERMSSLDLFEAVQDPFCFLLRLILKGMRVDLSQGAAGGVPGTLHDIDVRNIHAVKIRAAEMTKVMEAKRRNVIIP